MTVRQARDRAGLTREDLAADAGVSVRQLADIEHGRAIPRRATRAVLSVALRRALAAEGVTLLSLDWPTTALKEAA